MRSRLPRDSFWSERRNGARGAALANESINEEFAMPSISDARIVILATHGFEKSELFEPLERLRE